MSINFHQGSEHCAIVTLPNVYSNALIYYCFTQGYELVDVLDQPNADVYIVLLQPVGSDQLLDFPLRYQA